MSSTASFFFIQLSSSSFPEKKTNVLTLYTQQNASRLFIYLGMYFDLSETWGKFDLFVSVVLHPASILARPVSTHAILHYLSYSDAKVIGYPYSVDRITFKSHPPPFFFFFHSPPFYFDQAQSICNFASGIHINLRTPIFFSYSQTNPKYHDYCISIFRDPSSQKNFGTSHNLEYISARARARARARVIIDSIVDSDEIPWTRTPSITK